MTFGLFFHNFFIKNDNWLKYDTLNGKIEWIISNYPTYYLILQINRVFWVKSMKKEVIMI